MTRGDSTPFFPEPSQQLRDLMANARERDKPDEIRDPVLLFAAMMELRLREHDGEKGRHGWRDERLSWLFQRLYIEYEELRLALETDNTEAILKEAADVANFAMMIADVEKERMLAALKG
jgi:NTP pyrophosphatase (non-canonical NTP hydrolase)